jgi:transcriptional regulator with XRE-family HTH domain
MPSKKRRGPQPKPSLTKLGVWLRRMREKARLTQSEVAERIGVTPGHVSKLESGESRQPTYDTLAGLSALFNVSALKLMRLARVETRDSDAPGAL